MLKSIKRMLDSFEENKIIYCHWKSNEHLQAALEGDTDLDMLFLAEQRIILENVLSKCGIKRFRTVANGQYNAIEDFIGFDYDKAKIWHLHLHYKMTFGKKNIKEYTVTKWGEKILNDRIYSELGCYTSKYEHELILLYIRMALKLRIFDYFGAISSDDINEIGWLKERVDENILSNDAIYFCGMEGAKEIISLYHKSISNKRDLFKLQDIMVEYLRPYTAFNSLEASFYSYYRTAYSCFGGINRKLHLNIPIPTRRVSPGGGCVIAFLGSDGAGKSTTLSYVNKELSKKLDVYTVYMGSGDGSCSILRWPMKIIAQRIGGKGLGDRISKEQDDAKKKGGCISLKVYLYNIAKILWAITLAYEKKDKARQITKARNRGMIVLVDRYPQTYKEGLSDGVLLNNYYNSKYMILRYLAKQEKEAYEYACINIPDLFVKLKVPANVALKRKPEMTIEEILLKQDVVDKVYNYASCIKIDTSQSKAVTFSLVMDAVWGII